MIIKERMTVLFYESPHSWGLRGDPFLWDEMRRTLGHHSLPATENELKKLIEDAFKFITKKSLYSRSDFYIEKFSNGGMSSGYISIKFWKNTALSFLISRYNEISHNEIAALLENAKYIAKRYKFLTGKPLGITGEVAEFTAAKILNLELAKARQTGYDATKIVKGKEIKIQIKGRSISKKSNNGRLGKIRLDTTWDIVVLVLLDERLELISIYEADRKNIELAIKEPGSKSRNERGALSISQFKSIGKQIY